MGYYAVPGNQATISSSYKTAAVVTATSGALRRGKIAEIMLGFSANPNATDTYGQFDLSRQTAVGTSTAFTPNATDPADVAALATAGVNATVEGTITANSSVFNEAVNQRGSVRWVASQESQMLIYPATAANGFALRCLSTTYTGSVTGQLTFME